MITSTQLHARLDAEAKARTPSVAMPSRGGLSNPKFNFQRGADIGRTNYAALRTAEKALRRALKTQP